MMQENYRRMYEIMAEIEKSPLNHPLWPEYQVQSDLYVNWLLSNGQVTGHETNTTQLKGESS